MRQLAIPVLLAVSLFSASLAAGDAPAEPASLLPASLAPAAAMPSAAPAAPDTPAASAADGTAASEASAASAAAPEPEKKKAPPMKIPFRQVYGTIHAAEISFAKPAIEEEDELDTSPFGDNTAWGQLIVTITAGRSISRFDFVLEKAGTVYPCLAVAAGDDNYSVQHEKWVISAKGRNPAAPVRLLFPLPKTTDGKENFTPGTLSGEYKLFRHDALPQKGDAAGRRSVMPPDVIQFRVLPDGTNWLTSSDVKKSGGYYGMTSEEMEEAKSAQAASLAPANFPMPVPTPNPKP